MRIIIDSREKKPYSKEFDELGYKYVNKKLDTGDYSIEGFPDFAIERKELNDFVKSITFNRKRFEKELERAKKMKHFAVIVEATFFDIKNRVYRSKVSPSNVLANFYSLQIKHGITFHFVECRWGGVFAVIEMAKALIKYNGDKNEN